MKTPKTLLLALALTVSSCSRYEGRLQLCTGASSGSAFQERYEGCMAFGVIPPDFNDVYAFFPPPTEPIEIQEVQVLVSEVQNNGYDGGVVATLEIRDLSGTVLQTLTSIDLTTVAPLTWLSLSVPGDPIVSPSDFLIFSIIGDGTSGDFQFHFDSEVKVRKAS